MTAVYARSTSSVHQRVFATFERHFTHYTDATTARTLDKGLPFYKQFPEETLRSLIAKAFEVLRADLEQGTADLFPSYMRALALKRPEGSVVDMIRGIGVGFEVVSEHFATIFTDDLEAQLYWERQRNAILMKATGDMADAFVTTREARLHEQRVQLEELAAPLMPLARGILVLPLVGSIDAQRAQTIMASLLEAVARRRSEVVIIDITGVPSVDTAVAEHLVQSAQASRLLGSRVILVGISARTAKLLSSMGVDLGATAILVDLAAGIEYALRLQGRTITALPEAARQARAARGPRARPT